MKKVLTVLMILLMSAIGYAYDEVEKILEKGVLRVGTTLDYKPFTYKENGIERLRYRSCKIDCKGIRLLNWKLYLQRGKLYWMI